MRKHPDSVAGGPVPGLQVQNPVGWPVSDALTTDPPHPEAGTKEPIGSLCPGW